MNEPLKPGTPEHTQAAMRWIKHECSWIHCFQEQCLERINVLADCVLEGKSFPKEVEEHYRSI